MVPTNEVQERMHGTQALTEVLHALMMPSLSIAGVSALEAGEGFLLLRRCVSICTFVLVKQAN